MTERAIAGGVPAPSGPADTDAPAKTSAADATILAEIEADLAGALTKGLIEIMITTGARSKRLTRACSRQSVRLQETMRAVSLLHRRVDRLTDAVARQGDRLDASDPRLAAPLAALPFLTGPAGPGASLPQGEWSNLREQFAREIDALREETSRQRHFFDAFASRVMESSAGRDGSGEGNPLENLNSVLRSSRPSARAAAGRSGAPKA